MSRFINITDSFLITSKILHGRSNFLVRHKSHYASLGLDPTASQSDIKSAYYKLSLKFHPDKNDGSPESVAKFREIAEAYEVLGNPEKKRAYDGDDYTRTSYRYKPRSSPRTGRDQFYNYEEHIRQHYEKFYRQKQAEQEQFRRRWEADRRQRDWDHWSSYRRTEPVRPQMAFKDLIKSKTFLYTVSFWLLILISGLFIDGDQVKTQSPLYPSKAEDRNRTIYYNVRPAKAKEE